jgi:hypothetical protein
MKRKSILSIVAVGVLAVIMTIGAVAYHSASAASATPTVNQSTTLPGKGARMDGRAGLQAGVTNENLAAALGISVEQLNTAQTSAYSEALKQAVAQGLITQAQADELTANGSAFPFGKGWDGWLNQNGLDYDTFLAQALGISVDQLKAAYQTATFASIDQAVTDGRMTQEQADLAKGQYALRNNQNFQDSMLSAYQSAVQQAVKDGVITQAQADLILKDATSKDMPGFPGLGGPGGDHGFEGRHGFGQRGGKDNAQAQPPVDAVPTATP